MSLLKETLDRYFAITEAGSSLSVELRAGLTTFLTMAYILFVNPMILGKAIAIDGVDVHAQLLTATALAAALGSLIMGLWAKYPFALAPGMGMNAYFAFSVVLGQGISWQTGLGAVFLGGLAFVVLSVLGARALILHAIPASIKTATGAGIGLFLAIIGCESAGFIQDHPQTLLQLGNLANPAVHVGLAGLLLTATLLAWRIKGALLIGIASTSLLAIVTQAPAFGGKPFSGLNGRLIQAPVWPTDLFLQLDIAGALQLGLLGIVFTFFFVDLFDAAGTLLGLAEKGKFMTPDGRLPRADQAFTADAVATASGALFGTTSATTYIESAAGIEDGGKTGLVPVVVALLFLGAIFLSPLAAAVPAVATAPVLIIVGALMMSHLGKIDWDDYRESIPAFLTIIGMPLTYSIANGISFGIISYTLINALSGRARQLPWLMWLLTGLLVARYAYLGHH